MPWYPSFVSCEVTSDRVLMALPSRLLVPVGGRPFQRLGPSPTLGSLGPSYHQRHKSRVSLRGLPLCPWCFGHPFGEVRDIQLLLIRHPGYLSEDIPWMTIVQRPAYSAGDVFQLPVLVLEVVSSALTRWKGVSGSSKLDKSMSFQGCFLLGPALRQGCEVVALLGSGTRVDGGGLVTTGYYEDSTVLVSVTMTSGPSLYTTSSSAMVHASSSASLMPPYC